MVQADDELTLMRDTTRSIVIFGVASLVAVAAGCVAMAQSGVAPSSWLRSVVAWAVGAGLAWLLVRCVKCGWGQTPTTLNTLAVGALIATLFGGGVEGVHRWLDIGPLHLNAATLLLPSLIVGLATMLVTSPIGLAMTVIAAAVLLAQPDASQLTAFAIAASILVVRSGVARRWKACALLVAVAFVIAGWMRPDPLDPVAEVEQIFTMCVEVPPFLALLAGLAAATVAPLSFSSPAGHALSAYFVSVSIAPFFGWFPVPLVGLGMSFPVGFWLGMGSAAGVDG